MWDPQCMEILSISSIMYSYYIHTKATEGSQVHAVNAGEILSHAAMYVVPYALAKLSACRSSHYLIWRFILHSFISLLHTAILQVTIEVQSLKSACHAVCWMDYMHPVLTVPPRNEQIKNSEQLTNSNFMHTACGYYLVLTFSH